ncbi:PGF-pre-PGF domain-containing protein [Methanolobus profundi]|uniref:PGF-pre-PGF domain-containing protein n=1 Tax=Methanolobus profundi TaxID=487685 RepID=A0A1I4NRW0_9EURY|nr:PGF-pre-PGF domain-containing protein [Methanolobus profundi]SFM18166.1 PGF-pre-PGF domain-containing protein [Methanolobus profundi]
MKIHSIILLTILLIILVVPVSAEVSPGFNVTFSPDEDVITSRIDREPEFIVNVSESSDIFWYLDDELVNTYNDVNDSVYVPDLSETGNYSIRVNVSNLNGTDFNQWYWVATATPSQIMSSGGGSSGSSSGSVSSGEDYENIMLKEVQMLVVNKGTTTVYSFPDGSDPIDSVAFVSSVNAGYVKTTLEVLKNRSSAVSKDPDDLVYCYSNIILSNTGLENKLSDTRIVFHVDREWIDENDIVLDSIRLKVFGSSNWKSFPVKVIDENENTITFVSTTTEFGNFAITGKVSEDQDEDVVVVDLGADTTGSSSSDAGNGSDGNGTTSESEDVLTSVLRSMTELFIKRNPVSN